MDIRLLQRKEIDDSKWDTCVKSSTNGNVFAHSWFLDIVCPGWEAVVAGDYEVVVPLPVKSTCWVKHVYSPYLTPYLGIINRKPINKKVAWAILNSIPYYNVSMVLNAHNRLPGKKAMKCGDIRYVVLDLISDIKRLESHFRPEMIPVIDLYNKKKITVIRALNATDYIEFARRANGVTEDHLKQLLHLITFAIRYKSAGLYAAYDGHNEMIAGAFLLKSNSSLSLIHCATLSDDHFGVKTITYHILKHNAGSNLTMEFPFYSAEVGRFFTTNEHICLVHKKGLSKWISLLYN